MSDKEGCGGLAACLIFGFILGFAVSSSVMSWLFIDDYRAKAVERGVAVWDVDQKSGRSTFKWKELPK